MWPKPEPGALAGIRICDFTGQLAGAGATKILAALGAEVIRIEDPVRQGRWDILRGTQPFVGEHRGIEAGGAFNNHSAGKLGITLNLRDDRAKELLAELVAVSDAVTENFAAGVMDRLGFGYEALCAIKPDIVYVSNSGFGASGPYASFRSWGPIAQAVSGLTFQSGLPDLPPAGWGYSFMDHTGAYYMAIAIGMALFHRRRTGEGQWVDLACIEAAGTLHGAASLDFTVNGRTARRNGMPNSNRSQSPAMAPHGIFACRGDDEWVAIAVRSDDDWQRFAHAVNEPWANEARWERLAGRLADEDELDRLVGEWTAGRTRQGVSQHLIAAEVPAAPVLRPSERIDGDPRTEDWGMWVTVPHREVGDTRVEGLPVRLSETDWAIGRAAPCLGEDNRYVFGEVLGRSDDEIAALAADGVI
ncbi:CaiB/BaiF CoA transferase family protein [Candidatus Poriferisodalis sp.]|uniref:CaiB/BaiF CoA transferase family protein n=1 Tax=Candidatus Poriferisodalis sp. TaxID=3101277 RepID=UPI003C6ECFF6